MGKAALAVLVAAVAGFFLLRGDDEGKAVRSCLEQAGATVEKAPNAKRIFPSALALGSTSQVEELPALDRASVYGVRQGPGEAILFFARNGEDAESLEETFVGFGAGQGVRLPARRAGGVLLVWTVPLPASESYALDTCIE